MTDELVRCFKTLDLEPTASPEMVKQAYRELVQILHPDRFMQDDRLLNRAQEKLKEVNAAYQTIRAYQAGNSPRPAAVPPEPRSQPSSPPPEKIHRPSDEQLKAARASGKTILLWFFFIGSALGVIQHADPLLMLPCFLLGVLGLRGWLARTAWKVVATGKSSEIVGFYVRCLWRYFWRSSLTFIGIALALGILTGSSPETTALNVGGAIAVWFLCSVFVVDVPFWIWRRLNRVSKESVGKTGWAWAGALVIVLTVMAVLVWAAKQNSNANHYNRPSSAIIPATGAQNDDRTASASSPAAPAGHSATKAPPAPEVIPKGAAASPGGMATLPSASLSAPAPDALVIPFTREEKTFFSDLARAEEGSSEALYTLARDYERGRGTEQNYSQAFKLFKMVADRGGMAAQYKVAQFYYRAMGVAKDDVQAAYWFRKSAEQGLPDASYSLAVMYEAGFKGEPDLPEAAKWYLKAAEQGDGDGQAKTGLLYSEGVGVKQDAKEAFRWTKRAAEQGSPEAQINLAKFYGTGSGVTQDRIESTKWTIICAARGNPQSVELLSVIKTFTDPAIIKEAERRAANFVPTKSKRSEPTPSNPPRGGE